MGAARAYAAVAARRQVRSYPCERISTPSDLGATVATARWDLPDVTSHTQLLSTRTHAHKHTHTNTRVHTPHRTISGGRHARDSRTHAPLATHAAADPGSEAAGAAGGAASHIGGGEGAGDGAVVVSQILRFLQYEVATAHVQPAHAPHSNEILSR